MQLTQARFLLSVHASKQLPDDTLPEIAFAGRSNVGKSSLINCLVKRKGLVKTSSRPGKTRGLNFFQVDEDVYLVDLPGYGFAQVSKAMQNSWQELITHYLETREQLVCVVVIIDMRHELKAMDRSLIDWLRYHGRTFLPVYTKADKISRNKQMQYAARLDAALTIGQGDRVIFSSKTGQGRKDLLEKLAIYIEKN